MWSCPTCGSTNESDWESCIICGTSRQTARDALRPRKGSVTVPVEELMDVDSIPDPVSPEGPPTVLGGFAAQPPEPPTAMGGGFVPPYPPPQASPEPYAAAPQPVAWEGERPAGRRTGINLGIVIGALVGLMALCVALVLLTGGEPDPEPTVDPTPIVTPMPDPEPIVSTSLSISVTEESKSAFTKLKVTGSSSSSDLVYEGTRFSAAKLLDGDLGSGWQEGVSGLGEGESVTLYLDGEQSVSMIRLAPGNQQNAEAFRLNSRPRVVRFVFSDGNSIEWEFADEMGFVQLKLGQPVRTSYVQIILVSAYDAQYQDTGFSEVELYR